MAEQTPVPPAEPPPPPPRFERREPDPASRRLWLRWGAAWLGLILFVGCLLAFLSAEPWFPKWTWRSPGRNEAKGVVVVIDPGHGGGDSGAVAQGVIEKALNLDVGRRIAATLAAHRIAVRLTRNDDRFITLDERVQIANKLPHAVFVSIHFNDAPVAGVSAPRRASGIETFYSDTREIGRSPGWVWTALLGGLNNGKPVFDDVQQRNAAQESRALADSIQGALIVGTSAADRGIKERSLFVTRRVQGPAVLVEGGFVSNPAEARRLGDPAYRQRLAESIAGGILRYLAEGGSRKAEGGSQTTIR